MVSIVGRHGDITLCADARLVTRLLNFALNHEASLYNPLLPIEPAMLGAMRRSY